MKLSTLAIILGLGMGSLQIYGLLNPKGFAAAVKKFPRNVAAGVVLMLLATVWFIANVNGESDSDFAAMKPTLMALFVVVGVGSCIYVQDFLAVRGLAVLLLLLARLMLDTQRLADTDWRWVIGGWAYLLVVGGIWFTITPHRLRDLLEWGTASERRVKIGCGLRLAFAMFVVALGLTVF
jgi:hypothetical protein